MTKHYEASQFTIPARLGRQRIGLISMTTNSEQVVHNNPAPYPTEILDHPQSRTVSIASEINNLRLGPICSVQREEATDSLRDPQQSSSSAG
ncbi:hypothetical protein MES5069_360115 [Mesorhizobium escarrei]|uniref:Uncharacterized protein n=1 Tax=Mesorhizobium escarrei TaxID=666018 RepID=A0ABM9E1S5_9HYPH|nr:hypothetical protein MES5069_360115 [Mesorhizobium escarrei]